jgi:nucleotide-binding universal stress UspA family protein
MMPTEEILACLDGSRRAETILPLALGLARAKSVPFTLLRVVADTAELAAQEQSVRERARRFDAQVKFLIAPEAASAIVDELKNNPRAIPAMTTHGRTAWIEAILGSVALNVVRGAARPVLLYRPRDNGSQAPQKITTIVAALDGSDFAGKIIPFAADMASSIRAGLTLVQALPASVQSQLAALPRGDVLESAYLSSTAAEIKNKYGIEPSWDTLHGEPGEALCRYVSGMPNTILALTSHGRSGFERSLFGSVAAKCVRSAEVPILLYWPGK